MNSIGRILILGVFSLFSTLSFGQKLKGKLVNENQEPWAFASIIWAGTQIGTTTDENGNFKIERQDKALVISHLSFETDTLAVPDPLPNPWIIQVSSGIELKTFNVVDRNGGTRINMLDPKNIEVLGSEELTKAACCNLSEAFETNASVDVSSSDASTGLKEIYMLGLNGNNILFTQGNIPDQLGIDRPFGLMSIPGPWLSEIAISKGVSSVVNASEGLAGQINYCEEPYGENQGRVNVYGNAFGRMETNVGARIGSDEEWNHRLQGHFSQRKGKIDKNKDGFYDVPEMTSSALSYQAQKETKKMHLNFFVRASDHTIDGGQTSSVPGSLKTSLKHDRIKVGGKVGFKGKTPGNSFGIQYFGKSSNSTGKVYNKTYNFQENRVYVNAIYQTFIQSSDYKIKSGISLNVLEQDISFFQPSNSIGPHDKNTTVPTNRYANPLIIPAPFTELDATFNEKWSGVFGLRFIPSPQGNMDGLTPRLNLRYAFSEDWVIKGVFGKSARVFNPITENIKYFSSTQELNFEPEVEPLNRLENGTNMGLNTVYKIQSEEGLETSFSAEYYYTVFKDFNNVLMDNLGAISFAQRSSGNWWGFGSSMTTQNALFQVKTNINTSLDLRVGYRYVDSKRPGVNGEIIQEWFVPKHRGFLNMGYHFEPAPEREWKFDFTLHTLGTQPLPSAWYGDKESPAYIVANAQINYIIGQFEFYLGSENLTDYKIPNPIRINTNESGEITDAMGYGSWGPVAGRNVYFGLTWNWGK